MNKQSDCKHKKGDTVKDFKALIQVSKHISSNKQSDCKNKKVNTFTYLKAQIQVSKHKA